MEKSPVPHSLQPASQLPKAVTILFCRAFPQSFQANVGTVSSCISRSPLPPFQFHRTRSSSQKPTRSSSTSFQFAILLVPQNNSRNERTNGQRKMTICSQYFDVTVMDKIMHCDEITGEGSEYKLLLRPSKQHTAQQLRPVVIRQRS